MLTAVYCKLGSFLLMDRENKQSMVLPTMSLEWTESHCCMSMEVSKCGRICSQCNWIKLMGGGSSCPDVVTREQIMKYLSQSDKAKLAIKMDTFKLEALESILNLTGRKLDDCCAF